MLKEKERTRRGGKPSLSGDIAPGARTTTTTVALGDHRLTRLRALAAARGGQTVSDLIREAVDTLLARAK